MFTWQIILLVIGVAVVLILDFLALSAAVLSSRISREEEARRNRPGA